MAVASTGTKNDALRAAADLLVSRTPEILSANAIDVEGAEAGGVAAPLVDRLRLSAPRVEAMANGLPWRCIPP